jgi:hypothetical protein
MWRSRLGKIGLVALAICISSVGLLAQEAAIKVESKSVKPGETTTIDITVFNLPAPGVNDVQGELSYNPSVMRVKSLDTLSGFTLFASSIDNAEGKVQFAIAMVGAAPIRQGGLIRLEVEAVGQAGEQTALELAITVFRDPDGDDIFTAEQLQDLIQAGTFTITNGEAPGPGPLGEARVHVFPNPARTEATFSYELPEGTTEAMLWVFSLTGALVFSKELDVNTDRFTWDLRDLRGREAPNGPYYYRVSALSPAGSAISPVGRLVIRR